MDGVVELSSECADADLAGPMAGPRPPLTEEPHRRSIIDRVAEPVLPDSRSRTRPRCCRGAWPTPSWSTASSTVPKSSPSTATHTAERKPRNARKRAAPNDDGTRKAGKMLESPANRSRNATQPCILPAYISILNPSRFAAELQQIDARPNRPPYGVETTPGGWQCRRKTRPGEFAQRSTRARFVCATDCRRQRRRSGRPGSRPG